ncbi:cell cycle checkpoint control protein RAD9A [Astyanax mexicanus]|uniref:Cell cycle checkpoint control protein n=1 Tax=Astyanax mexicanus TaxID=7994 RepID=A0A8B9K130_ASTMX|nr:cell cycle checkpoint control protein RAD9A [Astyanax mexicanus]
MDCVTTGGNVKVLAKAIHSLSKIGEELYLEPVEDGLTLRAVNSSRSAFACFLLSPLFFQRYQAPSDHAFRCKMPIKSMQAVFRSLSSLERSVEKCRIELNSEKNRLTVTLHCKHGLLKTHNLSFQDCESLQAVFDKENCANVLRAQPRLWVDTVLHFPPSLEEVNVSVNGERVWLRNHLEDDADPSRAMMTELCLSAEEFDHFAVRSESNITFCLKELRGLLVFAESSGLPVSMHFDEPGSPVVLSVSDSVLDANFVLATLSEDAHQRNHNNNKADRREAQPAADDFMSDDMDSYLIAMEASDLPGDLPGPSHESVPPVPHSSTNHRARLPSEEEEEEEEEQVNQPPNKKFCSLFFGSVLPASSQLTNQTIQGQEVLASDSDDEKQEE